MTEIIDMSAPEVTLKLQRGNTLGPKFNHPNPDGTPVDYSGGDLVLDVRAERRPVDGASGPVVRWSISNGGLVSVQEREGTRAGWQMVITPAQWALLSQRSYAYGLEHRWQGGGVRELMTGTLIIAGDVAYG